MLTFEYELKFSFPPEVKKNRDSPVVFLLLFFFLYTFSYLFRYNNLAFNLPTRKIVEHIKYLIKALPFLLPNEITGMFVPLEAKSTTAPLQSFANYNGNTWIDRHCLCPALSWTVFMEVVRTNNDDTEGWHHA